jgi:hypothetical protein
VVINLGVGVAQSPYGLGYGLDERGSIPSGGNDEIFSLRHRAETGAGAHPASYPMGIGGEADQSPPSSPEVKNAWSSTCTPPIRLHGVVLS